MYKFFGVTLGIMISIACGVLPPLQAATLYVDKDDECPGIGTWEKPYCSIQQAFDAAQPGDQINIREGATPYEESAKATGNTKSGTAANPIIVTSANGQNPILRTKGSNVEAAIWLEDVDHWTISNLTFDGTNTQTGRHAIMVYSRSRSVTNVRIVDNMFVNWGGDKRNVVNGAVITARGHFSQSHINVHNAWIQGNIFDGNRTRSIDLFNTTDVVIADNEITGQRCGLRANGVVNQVGIHTTRDRGTIIRDNHVHSFDTDDCNFGKAVYSQGIWCDGEGEEGQVYNNRVHNIPKTGILIEAACHRWDVVNNVVYNAGLAGIRKGNDVSDAHDNRYLNNTIYNVGWGIILWNGRNTVVKNNIVMNGANGQIIVKSQAAADGAHDIDSNLYWNAGNGDKIGGWNSPAKSFSEWQTACRCDDNSLNTDPDFVNPGAGNFRLSFNSPAIGVGDRSVYQFGAPILGGGPLGRIDLGAILR